MDIAYYSGGFLELTDSINQKTICCPIDLLAAWPIDKRECLCVVPVAGDRSHGFESCDTPFLFTKVE